MTQNEIERELLSESHERATEALSRIDGHEKVCAERALTINQRLSDIADELKLINGRLWRVAAAAITTLIGALLTVLAVGAQQLAG